MPTTATNKHAAEMTEIECPNCQGVEIVTSHPGTIYRRVIGESEGKPIYVFDRYEADEAEAIYRCLDCGKYSKHLMTFSRSASSQARV